MRLRAWLKASRPLASANIVIPLAFGHALGVATGAPWAASVLLWSAVFALLDLLFIVWSNDVADQELDAKHADPTFLSGGSRVLVEGLLTPTQLRRGAIAAAASLLGWGTYLAVAEGRTGMIPLSVAALVLMWLYSFPPARLSYRGGGEWLQGLGVGLVLPVVGFHLHTGDLSLPWIALLPSVLLGTAGNVLTALPDTRADAAGGKHTLPVRVGEAAARRLVMMIIGACALAGPFVVVSGPISWATSITSAVALAYALRVSGRADSIHRGTCLRFVIAGATAANVLWIGWSVALA